MPSDAALAKEWGRLVAEAMTLSHPLGQPHHANDAWIAATARRLGVPLVTGNTGHFQDMPGLTVVP